MFEFNWHIPAGGDGRWMCQEMPERLPRLSYLTQVAQAAENAGFDRVLVPCSFSNSNHGADAPYVDAFTTGVACLAATRRIKVLIAHRPGFVNPGVFAHMCAAADEMSEGRLELNIVTAGAPGDMEQYGDALDHDARYRRAVEFIEVLKALWTHRSVDYDGEFFEIAAGRLAGLTAQVEPPPIHLVGASPAAIDAAAKQADVYMMQGHAVEDIGARIAELRSCAGAFGRSPRFCVAATVFTADTESEARRWHSEFVQRADLDVAARRRAEGRTITAAEDLAVRAATADHESWIHPNIWGGQSHLSKGVAWVGSHEAIANLFAEYASVGITGFQMFGYPYLEQAQAVGEHLLPIVRAALADSAGQNISSI